jgi:hypothetical protein
VVDVDPGEAVAALERERLAALTRRDLARALQLHADDYELVTPGGRTLSRAEYLDGIQAGELDYRVFEPASAIRARVFDGGVVLRYQARIEIQLEDDLDADLFWHTDIWEWRADRWQVVWSQATRIRRPEPEEG